MLRCERAVFGPVASDPAISRLITTLAASGEKALQAIQSARSEVRDRVESLAGRHAPDVDGQVTVDLAGVLVIAHFDREACVRCSVLRPDPAQRERLVEIRDNLIAWIAEAEREGCLGEVEGLQDPCRRPGQAGSA